MRKVIKDSSWDIQQVAWCLSDENNQLICEPLLPDLDMYYQRMGHLPVHSQIELVPLEPAVSTSSHSTSMTLATGLSNLSSSQRPQFSSREFLPFPLAQQAEIPIRKSWHCPQEAWAPGRENQTVGREDIRQTQASNWVNQRENSRKDAWKVESSGRQLSINFGKEDNAKTKVLEWDSQRLEISKTDGEILTPGWESQDHMGVENRANIQELGKRNQREARGENPPETQAHRVNDQEQLRSKVDAETQTPEGGNQDKNRNELTIEAQVLEQNKMEARQEDGGETQTQGLGKQGHTGSENGEEFQVSEWGKQDQIRSYTNRDTQAEERRNKDQVGGEDVVQNQISGRENLGELKQEDGVEIQTLGWGKQGCVESGNVTEIQTIGWEKQDQGRSEKTWGETQKQLSHEFQVRRGSQGLRRGKDAGETQISRKKKLREIREEDWVVIQTLWWEDQRPVASEIDREFELSCWGNQNQTGGEHEAEIQVLERTDQRKDRDEDGINTLVPEVENQGQLGGETLVDTHLPDRRNQEQFGDETSKDIQVPETENLKAVKGEDGKESQELGEENQSQLSYEINGKIHIPKWKNQEHVRSKDGANTKASGAENWGELTCKTDEETHSAEWKKEEQAGGENGIEVEAPEKGNQRKAGDEDGAETQAPREENQSQLRGDMDRKTHLLEWKNQEQMGGEDETEIQAPEKRNQREARAEDGVETQRPEKENLGQLDSEIGDSHSPGRRTCRQSGGKNDAENQTLKKRNPREIGSKDGRKVQRLRGVNQRLLKSKVNGNTCSSKWMNQVQIGGENGAEIQMQGKRNLRGTTGDDGRETPAPGGDYQEQLSQIDGEIQIGGQENQKKGGDEDAAEVSDVGNQRKHRAEDAGGPGVPKGEIKDQLREKDGAKGNLRDDYSGGEGLPALTGSGYETMEQEHAMAFATCPEMKPLLHRGKLLLSSGEGKHLASQSRVPARRHRVGISPAFPKTPHKPQRSQQRNTNVGLGKASGLAWQPQNPQSLAASLHLPSSHPSNSCGQAPQAATALTVLPKWPVLKKSQQLLLKSLMWQKIAHLKWGLHWQILESHSLFNLLHPCPLPFGGVQLPGLYATCELQRQRKRLCKVQSSKTGLKSPEKSQRVQNPERKGSKLPMQARALEKCGQEGLGFMGISIHSQKPQRVRPRRDPRERQDVQEEAPPRAKLSVPRKPRPAAESRKWCGQERIREASSENSRDRKMVRPGVSQMVKRAPSRVGALYSRADHSQWRKESTPQKASKPPGLKCQQAIFWRRQSEPMEGRRPEQQSSSHSTDASSFKVSLHSATGSLSLTHLNKTSGFPHLAQTQHSACNVSWRGSDLTLLPNVGDPHVREDSIRVHTSVKRVLQPSGHSCAGAASPKTGNLQSQREPENPNGSPQNPAASKKFGFMKHLRCFLLQHCFRK